MTVTALFMSILLTGVRTSASLPGPQNCVTALIKDDPFQGAIEDELRNSGILVAERPGHTLTHGDWSVTPQSAPPKTQKSIEALLQLFKTADYQFLGEYYVIRFRGDLTSIAFLSTYSDWNLSNNFENLIVGSRWAHLFHTEYSTEAGHFIPANLVLFPVLEKMRKAKVRIHHTQAARIETYPVPSTSLMTNFENERYLRFGPAYAGPNLQTNPYSAHLLFEAVRILRSQPEIRKILVLGSGLGYEAVHLLKVCSRCQVDVSEIDSLALTNTRLNLRAHRLEGRSQFFLSDLFEKIPGRYDLIVFAPPRPVTLEFLNSTRTPGVSEGQWEEHLQRLRSDRSQFDFGADLLTRTLQSYVAHLEPGGQLLVMSDAQELPRLAGEAHHFVKLHQGTAWGGQSDSREGTFAVFKCQPRER